jgi:hypothetical protein
MQTRTAEQKGKKNFQLMSPPLLTICNRVHESGANPTASKFTTSTPELWTTSAFFKEGENTFYSKNDLSYLLRHNP